MKFPEAVFEILILSALYLMAIGAVTLLILLFNDIKSKKLW